LYILWIDVVKKAIEAKKVASKKKDKNKTKKP
jgi:hypothetical protein